MKLATSWQPSSIPVRVAAALTILVSGQLSAAPDTTVVLPGGATMDLVWVEAGTFDMGTTQADRDHLASVDMWTAWMDNQLPAHRVSITRGFYIGKTEVTQGQYRAVMARPVPWEDRKWLRVDPDDPAVNLSWEDMQEFLRRLNVSEGDSLYRLPTEAEWEYACRAGTSGPWSDDRSADDVGFADYTGLTSIAWIAENACRAFDDCGDHCPDCFARPVGTRAPNPWGIHDMHGNVYEVVSDWYGPYSDAAQTDPAGPASGEHHVRRGGDITGDAFDWRHDLMTMSAFRDTASPPLTTGFRVVRMARPEGVRAQARAAPWVVARRVVALEATGSSPRGSILEYEWREAPTNPAVGVLTESASPSPRIRLDRLGSYRFSLRVSDGVEWSPADPITVEAVGVDSVGSVTLALDGQGTTMDFVWVDPGTLTVGLTAEHEAILRDRGQWWQGRYQEVILNSSLAQPAHVVRITHGYYLGRYEVTQAQWSRIMGDAPWRSPSSEVISDDNRPAVWISWYDARAFVTRLNQLAGIQRFRLPTEAEWERASLADSKGLWSFGNDDAYIWDFAWFYSNAWFPGLHAPQPVGGLRPNRLGLQDMDGNVMEWTATWFDRYGSASTTDPFGSIDGSGKVYRGGSFRTPATSARERFASRPDNSYDFVGVRLIAHGPKLDSPVGDPLYEVPSLDEGPGPWMPGKAAVVSARPNPFHEVVHITYRLGAPSSIDLAVYNMAGQRIATLDDGTRRAGEHAIVWDGRVAGQMVASGVYLCRLRTDDRTAATTKILLLR